MKLERWGWQRRLKIHGSEKIQPLQMTSHLKTLLDIKPTMSASTGGWLGSGHRIFSHSLSHSSAVTLLQQLRKKKKGELLDISKIEKKRQKKQPPAWGFGEKNISLNCQWRTEKPARTLWKKTTEERSKYWCSTVELRDGCPGQNHRKASRPEGSVPLPQELPFT